MERTIDGIDYIAKSEVLRIIDEEGMYAGSMRDQCSYNDPIYREWNSRVVVLRSLRNRLSNSQGR